MLTRRLLLGLPLRFLAKPSESPVVRESHYYDWELGFTSDHRFSKTDSFFSHELLSVSVNGRKLVRPGSVTRIMTGEHGFVERVFCDPCTSGSHDRGYRWNEEVGEIAKELLFGNITLEFSEERHAVSRSGSEDYRTPGCEHFI